jgi:hypothetical protein
MRFSSANARSTDHSFERVKLIEVNFFRRWLRKLCRQRSAREQIQQQDGPIGSHACDDVVEFADASVLFIPFAPRGESSFPVETSWRPRYTVTERPSLTVIVRNRRPMAAVNRLLSMDMINTGPRGRARNQGAGLGAPY